MFYCQHIKLTDEICQILELCPKVESGDEETCEKHCPLFGACLEYWTGDNSCNK